MSHYIDDDHRLPLFIPKTLEFDQFTRIFREIFYGLDLLQNNLSSGMELDTNICRQIKERITNLFTSITCLNKEYGLINPIYSRLTLLDILNKFNILANDVNDELTTIDNHYYSLKLEGYFVMDGKNNGFIMEKDQPKMEDVD
jgi:hypothetical protein